MILNNTIQDEFGWNSVTCNIWFQRFRRFHVNHLINVWLHRNEMIRKYPLRLHKSWQNVFQRVVRFAAYITWRWLLNAWRRQQNSAQNLYCTVRYLHSHSQRSLLRHLFYSTSHRHAIRSTPLNAHSHSNTLLSKRETHIKKAELGNSGRISFLP